MIIRNLRFKTIPYLISPLLLCIFIVLSFFSQIATAAQISNRTIKISSSLPSATGVKYSVSFSVAGGYNLGSIAIQFCQESPLEGQPCSKPAVFDASTATLTAQSGETGFSVHANTTAGRVVLGRAPSLTSAGTVSYDLDNITNPSATGQFYARMYLYSTNDGTGSYDHFGGIAMSTSEMIGVTAEVPPFLLFCSAVSISGYDCATAAGAYINFGELSKSQTKSATSQMVLATNADNGLGVYIVGNTLTSGNNIIDALIAQQASVTNTPQFGLNLRANAVPNVGQDSVGLGAATVSAEYNTPNQFRFVNNDTTVTGSGPIDYIKFTSSYIVNIDNTILPGIYSTTIAYICLANF
jgi:hypothetical protein